MRLVVGLGNPGNEFVGTRHNVGWEAVDATARKFGWLARAEDFNRLARNKFDGLLMDGSVTLQSGMERILLLKPTTFMNDSGRSVLAAMTFFQVSPPEIMVVLDDLALPSGSLRLRKNGSSGGHNGLKDIERVLGTTEYPRLRIGIDSPPPRFPGRDYVLGKFSEAQRKRIEPVLDRTAAAIQTWIEKGIEAAMNLYNVNENKKDEETK
jgi:PTH1 family peptidyl-tRNA hydrolase